MFLSRRGWRGNRSIAVVPCRSPRDTAGTTSRPCSVREPPSHLANPISSASDVGAAGLKRHQHRQPSRCVSGSQQRHRLDGLTRKISHEPDKDA